MNSLRLVSTSAVAPGAPRGQGVGVWPGRAQRGGCAGCIWGERGGSGAVGRSGVGVPGVFGVGAGPGGGGRCADRGGYWAIGGGHGPALGQVAVHWGRLRRIGVGYGALGQVNNLPQCGLTCPSRWFPTPVRARAVPPTDGWSGNGRSPRPATWRVCRVEPPNASPAFGASGPLLGVRMRVAGVPLPMARRSLGAPGPHARCRGAAPHGTAFPRGTRSTCALQGCRRGFGAAGSVWGTRLRPTGAPICAPTPGTPSAAPSSGEALQARDRPPRARRRK